METVILVLILINLAASAAGLVLLRGKWMESRRSITQPRSEADADDTEETGKAYLAEKRFSEGVLNVLNYENPVGRGSEI